MSDYLRWIAPLPPDPDYEVLEAHQMTRDFYHEVQQRHAFDHYCQWYSAMATQHRLEVQKMRGDFNFLGWFYRWRQ